MKHIHNKKIKAMVCLKCKTEYPLGDYFFGCEKCLDLGENSALTFRYEGDRKIQENENGFKRFADFLPYADTVYLGEGNTPLVPMQKLARDLGVNMIYAKNEFQNPTGSHKDRMNPFITARAIETGAEAVTCASSGNEAASLSAYAAADELVCVNVSTADIPVHWKKAFAASGAELFLTKTYDERLKLQRAKLEEGAGWYPATNLLDIPTSSSAYGIQGYKTISYEIYESLKDNLPDVILVPTCRGDLLYGIYEGFKDLLDENYIGKIPKLGACEPFPRLELVLEKGRKHTEVFKGNDDQTPSIGGGTATYQSQYALEQSGGFAVSTPDYDMQEAIRRMGGYGVYLENSSAIVYPCLIRALEQGKISANDTVLMVLTSNGYKNE